MDGLLDHARRFVCGGEVERREVGRQARRAKHSCRATPLFMAMQNSPYNKVLYILPSPKKPAPRGQLKCVELLLRAGARKEDAGMFKESVPAI